METVVDVLKAMGKATYREVAARMKIEPVEALKMLREQKEQGLCDFSNGGWFVGSAKEPLKRLSATTGHQHNGLKGETPAPVHPKVIRELLTQNGAMSTVSLAKAVNRNPRGMVSVMCALERRGMVTKNGEGKGVTWSLTDISQPAAVPHKPEPVIAVSEKTTAQIVDSIPVFAKRPDDLIIPSARFISREIRRTKAKLDKLHKLRGAMRELRRHKDMLQTLNGGGE